MGEFIKKLIKQSSQQKISYCEFMDYALYDSMNGYYMRKSEKVGKKGDFITVPHAFPVFAKVLARFFCKAVNEGAVPPAICEIGGGDGRFAYEVLREWKNFSPETFSQLTYYMIEKSPYHVHVQQNELMKNAPFKHFNSLEEFQTAIGSFKGIVFSNEWFDALPVHVIEQAEEQIYEVYVSVNERDELEETFVCMENEKIKQYIADYDLRLQNGQRMEVPLLMLEKLEQLHTLFQQGLMVTIDYGYTFEELRRPEHYKGSLRGYFQHQLISNPLLHAGQMDLTSHIHFDSFIRKGKELGAELVLFQKQHEFLLSIGMLDLLQSHHDPNPFSAVSKQNRAVRSLIMDEGMSPYFHAIVQAKGISLESIPFLMKKW